MRKGLWGALLALTTTLAACGGGGGSGGSPNVVGVWKGTYSPSASNAPITIIAIVQQKGPTLLFDSQGYSFVLPQITNAPNFSGTASLSPPFGFLFKGIGLSEKVAVMGSVSDGLISGTISYQSSSIPFSLTPYTPFPGTLSVVPGKWSGRYLGDTSTGLVLNVSKDGSFNGSGSFDCAYAGTISLEQPDVNVFGISVEQNASGGLYADCATPPINMAAFESQLDEFDVFGSAAGTYYYVIFYLPNVSYVAVLKA